MPVLNATQEAGAAIAKNLRPFTNELLLFVFLPCSGPASALAAASRMGPLEYGGWS